MRALSANSAILEWGVPESDGGAPLEGYEIVMRDVKKTMWMQVGRTRVRVQKLHVKDLQVSAILSDQIAREFASEIMAALYLLYQPRYRVESTFRHCN